MTIVAAFSRTLLNSLPDWQLFLVFVGVAVVAALVGLFLTRRYLSSLRDGADAGVIAGMVAIAMTLFAFVLAFGVVSLYDQFNAAGDSVSGEASDLAQIVRDSEHFPEATQARIDNAVRDYILEVRNREFAVMHDGKDDPKAIMLFGKIYDALQSYDPKTQSQIAFYGSAVTQLNHALSEGRTRRDLVDAALPKAFTTLIVLTAIVSLVTAFFVASKTAALEAVLVSCIAIIVGAGLLTVVLLQYPFSGSVSVSSQPFVEGVLNCVVSGNPGC